MNTIIEQEARRLFLEKGYDATSYSDIAAACNLNKTNVQRHFPKKELFVSHFFEDLLDSSVEYCKEQHLTLDEYYQSLYLIGQLHFGFLIATPELQRLTFDILSHRALTETLIDLDIDWASRYMTDFSLEEKTDYADNVATVMGGIYELVYRILRDGRNIDPQKLQKRAMQLFTFVQEAPGEFADEALSAELLAGAVPYLMDKLFQSKN